MSAVICSEPGCSTPLDLDADPRRLTCSGRCRARRYRRMRDERIAREAVERTLSALLEAASRSGVRST